MRKALLAVGILLCTLAAMAAGYFSYLRWAPRRTPSGQPPLQSVDAANFGVLKERFNADAARTRVLLLLSPT